MYVCMTVRVKGNPCSYITMHLQPVRAWFLDIAFVLKVSMCVWMCVCVCVRPLTMKHYLREMKTE